MSTNKAKKSGVPADKLALFDKLIAAQPEIERKGANNAYAAVNGNMFLLMQPSGVLAMRLPDRVREEFLEKYKAGLYEAYGAVMKEDEGAAEVFGVEPRACEDFEGEAEQEEELIAVTILFPRLTAHFVRFYA
jgi:hypothetical protein